MNMYFETSLIRIDSLSIIRIPKNISEQLPSRGMVMIQGTMNDIIFQAPLEPDGKGSHWFELSEMHIKKAGITIEQNIRFNIEPLNDWIEPEIPDDIMNAFLQLDLINQWNNITVKARWEWLRWIRSTKNPETRKKRIDVACSKLQKGDRRPCCFDTTRCTITEVSKSGVLFDS